MGALGARVRAQRPLALLVVQPGPVAAQRPEATYVCGRGDWRRLGYELAEDQWRQPIWTLAPLPPSGPRITEQTGESGELERRDRYSGPPRSTTAARSGR
jgi:hypothetical protein